MLANMFPQFAPRFSLFPFPRFLIEFFPKHSFCSQFLSSLLRLIHSLQIKSELARRKTESEFDLLECILFTFQPWKDSKPYWMIENKGGKPKLLKLFSMLTNESICSRKLQRTTEFRSLYCGLKCYERYNFDLVRKRHVR